MIALFSLQDDSGDLNDSLNKALKTAKHLKKMSHRMKVNLNDDIEAAYR